MSGVRTVTIGVGDAGARLDRWFARHYPHVPFGRLQKLLRTGQIRVDGGRVKADTRLAVGQTVRVPPLPDPGEAGHDGPRACEVRDTDVQYVRALVLFEDDRVIALNKPAGLAVQGGAKTKRHVDGLAAGLLGPGQDPPRLAHRLDRDTSGVLLLGKDPAATAALAKAFASHRVEKTYWAVTLGVPQPRKGLIKGFIRKAVTARGGDKEQMVAARHGEEGAVYARTYYAVAQTAAGRAALVALRPQTGRTHQLRFHMADLGTAIAGDPRYQCDREPLADLEPRLHLHARRIRLAHPSGRAELDVTAPLPSHMAHAFDTLGFDEASVGDPFA